MKQLLSIVASLGMVVMLSSVALDYDEPDNLGAKKNYIGVQGVSQGTASRVYVLVRFPDQGPNVASLTKDSIAVWDTNSDDGVSVRLNTASADGTIAGIVATTIPTQDTTGGIDSALGRRNWGYIQVYGKAQVSASAGGTNAHAVGDPFITSSDSGEATTIEDVGNTTTSVGTGVGTTDAAKAATAAGGFYLDAGDGTSTEYEVFVRLE